MTEELKQILIESLTKELRPGAYTSTEHIIEKLNDILSLEAFKPKVKDITFKNPFPTVSEIMEVDND